MTARQKIDAMAEARKWIGQVILPAIGILAGVLACSPIFNKERCK